MAEHEKPPHDVQMLFNLLGERATEPHNIAYEHPLLSGNDQADEINEASLGIFESMVTEAAEYLSAPIAEAAATPAVLSEVTQPDASIAIATNELLEVMHAQPPQSVPPSQQDARPRRLPHTSQYETSVPGVSILVTNSVKDDLPVIRVAIWRHPDYGPNAVPARSESVPLGYGPNDETIQLPRSPHEAVAPDQEIDDLHRLYATDEQEHEQTVAFGAARARDQNTEAPDTTRYDRTPVGGERSVEQQDAVDYYSDVSGALDKLVEGNTPSRASLNLLRTRIALQAAKTPHYLMADGQYNQPAELKTRQDLEGELRNTAHFVEPAAGRPPLTQQPLHEFSGPLDEADWTTIHTLESILGTQSEDAAHELRPRASEPGSTRVLPTAFENVYLRYQDASIPGAHDPILQVSLVRSPNAEGVAIEGLNTDVTAHPVESSQPPSPRRGRISRFFRGGGRHTK